MIRSTSAFLMTLAVIAAIGCGTSEPPKPKAITQKPADEVATVRGKLSPEDRALVEAQEWCVVSTDERLGSMGPPIKLDIKGQSVFVCCSGCKKKAEANTDKTLAKVEELKAKKKASGAAQ